MPFQHLRACKLLNLKADNLTNSNPCNRTSSRTKRAFIPQPQKRENPQPHKLTPFVSLFEWQLPSQRHPKLKNLKTQNLTNSPRLPSLCVSISITTIPQTQKLSNSRPQKLTQFTISLRKHFHHNVTPNSKTHHAISAEPKQRWCSLSYITQNWPGATPCMGSSACTI